MKLHIVPDHIGPCSGANYVRCSDHPDFPATVRLYDANNFACSNSSFIPPVVISVRFGRACRAFVNAWRQA